MISSFNKFKSVVTNMACSETHHSSKTTKYLILGLLLIYLVIHLASLSISPLPWFDETYMASITNAFSNGNGFFSDIVYRGGTEKESLTYGPIYFLFTAASTELFGFAPFGFRIVNLIATLLCVLLVYHYSIRKYKYSVLFLFVVLLDPILIQNAHSGRMDMLAMLFVFITYVPFFKSKYDAKAMAFAATAFVLAALTTPRAAILGVVPMLFYFMTLIKNKSYKTLPFLILPVFVLYSVWIFWKFGSYIDFINYYLNIKPLGAVETKSVDSFVGGNLNIAKHQWPVLGLFIILLIVNTIRDKKVKNALLVLPIFVFYLFVKDTGVYSAMIILFVYVFIFTALNTIAYKKLTYFALMVLFVVNLSIYGLKHTTILVSHEQRSAENMQSWLVENIPENSTIIGSDSYYYAAVNNNCKFQYFIRGGVTEDRLNYHYDDLKPDYILINDLDKASSETRLYLEKFVNRSKFSIDIPEPSGFNLKLKLLLKLLHINIISTYGGDAYKIDYDSI